MPSTTTAPDGVATKARVRKATTSAKATPAKKTPAKAPARATTAKATPAKKTPAKKTPVKTAAKAAPRKAAATKAAPVKKTPAKKAPATTTARTSAAKKATPAKKAPAKKAPARKAPAKTAPRTTAAKKATPAKATVRKTASTPARPTATAKPRATRKPATAPATKAARVATTAPTAPAVPVTPKPAESTGPEVRAFERPTAETRWRSRPWSAAAVRTVAVTVPLASSLVAGFVLSRMFARPSGAAGIGWWVGIALASTLVLAGVDRLARRLLPLAVLLKLSMAFPDQAPSRFSMAARAGSTRNLKDELRRAEELGAADEPAVAAKRILTLVGALAAHDRRTRGHSERVRAFNDLIAIELRLPQADRDRLRWAALLHDIGKLHVSPTLLNKPARPTEKEWAILKSHPTRGARITAPLAEWLGPWADTIVQHHERWDGTGYPAGLKETQIGMGARIVAVADAYEVMTAPRPYSRPVSAEAARRELARCAGDQFDPDVVRAFLNISIGSLRRTIGPISWLAQLPLLSSAPRLESAVGIAGRQVATVAATGTATGVLAIGAMHGGASHHQHHAHDAQLTLAGSAHSATIDRPADAPAVQAPARTHRQAEPSGKAASVTDKNQHRAVSADGGHRARTATVLASSGSGHAGTTARTSGGSSAGTAAGSSAGSSGGSRTDGGSTAVHSDPGSVTNPTPTDVPPTTGTAPPPVTTPGSSDPDPGPNPNPDPGPGDSTATPPPPTGGGDAGSGSDDNGNGHHGQDDGHGEDQEHGGGH